MKTVCAFLLLSSVTALASAGYIGNPAYVTDSGRAGEIGFVVQLLQLIGTQFGLNSVGNTRGGGHLSNEEAAAIVASLHAGNHANHGQSRLSSADTAAIVASLYANGHGHQSRTSTLSHDVIPAVVAGLYASGYGHKTHQVSSHTADAVKVATSSGHSSTHSGGHSSSASHSSGGGYNYRGHKK